MSLRVSAINRSLTFSNDCMYVFCNKDSFLFWWGSSFASPGLVLIVDELEKKAFKRILSLFFNYIPWRNSILLEWQFSISENPFLLRDRKMGEKSMELSAGPCCSLAVGLEAASRFSWAPVPRLLGRIVLSSEWEPLGKGPFFRSEVLTAPRRSSHAAVGPREEPQHPAGRPRGLAAWCGRYAQGFRGEAVRVSHVWGSVCGTVLSFFFFLSPLPLHPPWAWNLKPWDRSHTLSHWPVKCSCGTFLDIQTYLYRGFLLPSSPSVQGVYEKWCLCVIDLIIWKPWELLSTTTVLCIWVGAMQRNAGVLGLCAGGVAESSVSLCFISVRVRGGEGAMERLVLRNLNNTPNALTS